MFWFGKETPSKAAQLLPFLKSLSKDADFKKLTVHNSAQWQSFLKKVFTTNVPRRWETHHESKLYMWINALNICFASLRTQMV